MNKEYRNSLLIFCPIVFLVVLFAGIAFGHPLGADIFVGLLFAGCMWIYVHVARVMDGEPTFRGED